MEAATKPKSCDVQNGLKEIAQTNKEILELLDVIDEKQKQQKDRQTETGKPVSEGVSRDNLEDIDISEKVGTGPTQQGRTGDPESVPGTHGSSKGPERDKIKGSLSLEKDKEVQKPGPTMGKSDDHHGKQMLGNLKIIQRKRAAVDPDPGFSERRTLSQEQWQYGKCLKAKKTLLEQDNRICAQFNVPLINRGHVYRSDGERENGGGGGGNSNNRETDWSGQNNSGALVDKTGPDKSDHKTDTKTKGNKHSQQDKTEMDKKSAETTYKKETSKPVLKERKEATVTKSGTSQKKPLKSILKKPGGDRSHNKTDSRVSGQRGTEVKKISQSRPSTIATSSHQIDIKDGNIEENFTKMIQIFDARTDQGKEFLKMQAKMLRSDLSILCPEQKDAFHACADIVDKMSAADSNVEDPGFWQKIQRDMGTDQRTTLSRYLDELKDMFSGETGLDETLRALCLGSVAVLQSIIEGNFLERCTALGQHVSQHPEQFSDPKTSQIAVMRAWAELDAQSQGQARKGIMIQQQQSSRSRQSQPVVRTRHVEPVTYEVDKVEEKEEERVTINEGLWSEYAQEEVKKGQIAKDIRWNGMDTIFCVDISMSMKGEPMRQAKTFVKGFIEGVQNTKLGGDVYEHVALITFGSETKVQQHLTCDYFEVLRKLEHIQPGGPSPLFAGLTMTWAAIIGAGTVFSSNGYKIHPRVYLISDGKMTPSSFIAGSDSCSIEETKSEQSKVISRSVYLHKEYHLTINAVPVGEFDMDLLDSVTKETGGKIISPEEWKAEAKTFGNYLKACSTGQSTQLRKVMIDVLHIDPDDQIQMEEFLETHTRDGNIGDETNNNDAPTGTELEWFPPLGSRIRRTGNYSSHLYGTVTKHFKDGVGVTWDNEDEQGRLRVKMDGIDDIERVDTPRVLKDQLIAVGCRVTRGKDWSYGNQDGKPGNEGAVFGVQEDGIILVRWDHDGSKAVYHYGSKGRFDVEIVDPYIKASVSQSISYSKQDHDIKGMKDRNKQSHDKNKNVLAKGAVSVKEYKWEWRDKDGTWKSYPDGINTTIEASYSRNSQGSMMITCDNRQYGEGWPRPSHTNARGISTKNKNDTRFKIVFSSMEQMDINSSDKFPVSRK